MKATMRMSRTSSQRELGAAEEGGEARDQCTARAVPADRVADPDHLRPSRARRGRARCGRRRSTQAATAAAVPMSRSPTGSSSTCR